MVLTRRGHKEPAALSYHFTNNWFQANAESVWNQLVPMIQPRRILEIGSYEGASACFLLDRVAPDAAIELHCVDTWEGGIEHQPGGDAESDMTAVQHRFHANIAIAMAKRAGQTDIQVHKGYSSAVLPRLLADGRGEYFDFVYIDGSHQAPDVLTDAILGFGLLRLGGVMVFDDYLWSENRPDGIDPLRCPKIAIDAFATVFCRKMQILRAPLYQLYLRKTAR